MRLHEYLIAVDPLDFTNRDDEGFVNADEMAAVEVLFEVFEVEQRNVLAFARMDRDVILQPLDVQDVVEEYLLVFAAAFDKKVILVRLRSR